MKRSFAALELLLISAADLLGYSGCPPQWTTPPPPCETCPCPPGAGGNGPSGPGAGRGGPAGAGNLGGLFGGSGNFAAASGSGCSGCGGMPVWSVRESEVDYRLFDTPLGYTPAYGPPVNLDLVYQTWRPTDFSYYPANDEQPLFGLQWNCIWNSYIEIINIERAYLNTMGGRVIYYFDSSSPSLSDPDFEDGSRLELIRDGAGALTGGRVQKRDGSTLEFTNKFLASELPISKQIDPQGLALIFSYDGYGRLTNITDATGGKTTLTYGDLNGDSDPSNDRVVTQVSAPGGYVATFQYEFHEDNIAETVGWYLTNITDSAGISSSFAYESNSVIVAGTDASYFSLQTLTTPYGTTRFQYLGTNVDLYYGLSSPYASVRMTSFGTTLLITEPNGGQHLYLQADQAPRDVPVPGSFLPSVIPSGQPIGTLDTNRTNRNTFYFGPLQMSAISSTNVDSWGWPEFKRARIRHWLGVLDPVDPVNDLPHFSDTLGWEQAPSPDGSTEGQVTWYDYPGKDPMHLERTGTNTAMPGVIARVLPNGSTWYQYYEHNALGNPTLFAETVLRAAASPPEPTPSNMRATALI